MSRPEQVSGSSSGDVGRPEWIDESPVKAAGLAVAWIGGVVCGWRVFQQSNLLDAVLRGAATWLALIGLWLMALAFCRRYVLRSSALATGSGRVEPAPGGAAGPAET